MAVLLGPANTHATGDLAVANSVAHGVWWTCRL